MRKSFVVIIFTLAVAVAGVTEWASRRTVDTPTDGKAVVQKTASSVQQDTGADLSTKATTPAPVGMPADTIARTLVLGEGSGGFRLNSVTLSDDAIAKIDAMMTGTDPDFTTARFVIEGYTDNLGSRDVNVKIGMARALAVRMYLADQYEVPRDRIRVVSYGPDQPVADNSTQEGRALNRRVVIKVLTD
jgi:outer membrane protein OmpA-like peptidoglycan-associated protein